VAENAELRPGVLVDVPWGVDTFPGRVIETYVSGGALRVRIEVQVPGRSEAETLVLRAEDVILRSDVEISRAATSKDAMRYERDLLNALIYCIGQLPEPRTYNLMTSWSIGDVEVDALVRGPTAAIAVDVKLQIREFRHYVERLRLITHNISMRLGLPAIMLAVSPNPPQFLGLIRHDADSFAAENVAILRWRDERDTAILQDAVRGILAPNTM